MHPMVERLRWASVTGIVIAGVLGEMPTQAWLPNISWLPLLILIVSLVGLLASFIVGRFSHFALIKVIYSDVSIDTFPLRTGSRRSDGTIEPELNLEIELVAVWDTESIDQDIRISLSEEVVKKLVGLVQMLNRITLEKSEPWIELRKSVPRRFTAKRVLPLLVEPSATVLQQLEAIAEEILSSPYTLILRTSNGRTTKINIKGVAK